MVCTNGDNFPPAWREHPQFHLYNTAEECCRNKFGGNCSRTRDDCSAANGAAPPAPNPPDATDLADEASPPTPDQSPARAPGCSMWHTSIEVGDVRVCTNSDNYPPVWKDNLPFFFRDTSEACCREILGGGCLGVKDVCGAGGGGALGQADAGDRGSVVEAGFVELESGADDFEGFGSLPWLLGSPPEWEIDDAVAFSGSRSITNVPSHDEGASRTMTLKVRVPSRATLECKLRLDVRMPFDMFAFDANGERMATYYQRVNEWIPLKAVVEPGENVLEFRVQNGDKFPDFDRSELADVYGTGHVWLDQCSLG